MSGLVGGIPLKDYNRIHQWIGRKWLKKGLCEMCGQSKRTHWANKDHKYRLVREDWRELCSPCHMSYDRQYVGIRVGRLRVRDPRSSGGYLKELKQELKMSGIKWDKKELIAYRMRTYPWFKS